MVRSGEAHPSRDDAGDEHVVNRGHHHGPGHGRWFGHGAFQDAQPALITKLSSISNWKRFARLLVVSRDLVLQCLKVLELLLGPEITHEPDFQLFAVDVAVEIEKVQLQ